jgi:hypothetical protein
MKYIVQVMGGSVTVIEYRGLWLGRVPVDHPAWIADSDELVIVKAAVQTVRGW